jgi:dTMP kinase
VALDRIVMGRPDLKYYEAGLDIRLSPDPLESFKLFQARIVDEYELMVDEFSLTVMDATKTIEDQQRQMRSIVKKYLPRHRRLAGKDQKSDAKAEQKSA